MGEQLHGLLNFAWCPSDEPSVKELHENHTQLGHCDIRSDCLENEQLSNNTDHLDVELVSQRTDNTSVNSKSRKNTSTKKKKKLNKIRQKSRKKWKSLDCSDFGFHFSRMPCFSNEVIISEDSCSVNNSSESDKAENTVINDNEPRQSNDIAQNDLDDITFFSELGVDVLNCDYNDSEDYLYWDGVHFSKKIHPFQRLQNIAHHELKTKTKSTLAAKCQSDTTLPTQIKPARNTTKVDSDLIVSPPTTVYSSIKKYDKYRLFELECSSSKRIYIRRDRDRRKEKAHKAVKSKNCRSIFNNPGRKRLYMHHRLIKMHSIDLDFRGSVKSYLIPPMPKTNVAIDVAKDSFRADRKAAVNDQPAPVQNLNHALHEENCTTDHIESGIANFLISLQHRDLTPEDYDMLLRLDDTVKPKTVSESVLEKLRTEQIGPNGPDQGSCDWEPMCTICMESYVVGQERKFLPCDHDFHTTCIDRWLTNSSLNCPLDGLPIEVPEL
uniref:RING-type domain-containing protein n=1 Tax=Arion vulgaris TaxID=1028688 RepID=A0A0B6ZUE4_9EUPU